MLEETVKGNVIKINHEGRVMRTELRTRATPAQGWSAWADPAHLAGWFVDKAEGEPKKGNSITWVFETFNFRLPLEILEAIPKERLVLRGQNPGEVPIVTEITVTRDEGETVIKMVQSGFSTTADFDEEYEGMSSGWLMANAVLKHYLENHFGKTRSSFIAMIPASFEYPRALELYRTKTGLGSWLGDVVDFDVESGRYEICLEGTRLAGRILAITNQEVALSACDENAIIELKAFSMGPSSRVVSIRGNAWGSGHDELSRLKPKLESALGRLKNLIEGEIQ